MGARSFLLVRERVLIMQPKYILFCALFAVFSGCLGAAVDDFRDDARGVIDQARGRAEVVAQLSAEELRELWAIEYRTLVVPKRDLGDVDEFLNELGRDRWECYHVSDDLDATTFYLQRRASNAIPTLTRLLRLGRFVL